MRTRFAANALLMLCALFCLPLHAALAQFEKAPAVQKSVRPAPFRYDDKIRETSDVAVTIVVSGLSCTCARFAEDIRNVLNDLRPDGLRVMPVLGVGGLQNLNDVLFLRGIDMGVADEDNLKLLKKRDPKLYAGIEQRVQYITRLYNSEFHVLAISDIKNYDDLRGKKVNFNLKDSQTEVTADIIFDLLNIQTQRSNYDNDEALKKLRNKEIAAMIVLTGAPQAALAKLKKEDGLHFLGLDEKSLPGHDLGAIFDNYLPAEITHEQYPELVEEDNPVPTIGNRALLVTYAWPENTSRYKRVAKFTQELFDKIYQFHDGARHPKWKEVNLAAEVPGWVRFKPATDWLAQHKSALFAHGIADGAASANFLKPMFDQFVAKYRKDTGNDVLSAAETEILFARFHQFLQSQRPEQKTR